MTMHIEIDIDPPISCERCQSPVSGLMFPVSQSRLDGSMVVEFTCGSSMSSRRVYWETPQRLEWSEIETQSQECILRELQSLRRMVTLIPKDVLVR